MQYYVWKLWLSDIWFFSGYIATLEQNSQLLKTNMECNFGLLDILFKKKLLTSDQRSCISSLPPVYMQNVELLDKIMLHKERVGDFEMLFDAMRQTGQVHLVQYTIEGRNTGKCLLLRINFKSSLKISQMRGYYLWVTPCRSISLSACVWTTHSLSKVCQQALSLQ